MSPNTKRTFQGAFEGFAFDAPGSFVVQEQQNKAPRQEEHAAAQQQSSMEEDSYWTGSTSQDPVQSSSASSVSSEVLTSGASIEKNLLQNQQVQLTHESINQTNDSYWAEAVMQKERETSINSYWTESTTPQEANSAAWNATRAREYWSGL